MKLRIWHISNAPRNPFRKEVKDIKEAKHALDLLADYDLYLGDSIIFMNTQGVEAYKENEWSEWYSEEGNDIYQHFELEEEIKREG